MNRARQHDLIILAVAVAILFVNVAICVYRVTA